MLAHRAKHRSRWRPPSTAFPTSRLERQPSHRAAQCMKLRPRMHTLLPQAPCLALSVRPVAELWVKTICTHCTSNHAHPPVYRAKVDHGSAQNCCHTFHTTTANARGRKLIRSVARVLTPPLPLVKYFRKFVGKL